MQGLKDEAARLEGWLTGWDRFDECLLAELRLVDFGYSVELAFNLVRDVHGTVRPDVLENPRLVTLTLIGVTSLRLNGGLSQAMTEDPDAIDWGLSEVATVRGSETANGLALCVQWWGDRAVDVEFTDFRVHPAP